MKKVITIVLCILLITILSACSSNKLSGTYVSESGKYTVVFKNDGTCIWKEIVFDRETFFEGTYEKDGDEYTLYIKGDGLIAFNTSFTAKSVNGGLQITGGTVQGEIFSKK